MKKQYLSPTNLYELVENRYQELVQVKRKLEKRLAKYPEGKIHIVNCRGRLLYYLRMNSKEKSGVYIAKSETATIQKYLQKRYDEEAYKLIVEECKRLSKLITKKQSPVIRLREVYNQYPKEIGHQIEPVDIADGDFVKQWMEQPFEQKTIGEDIPVYITDNGEHVRSKSELNIANALKKAGIAYKYEAVLTLSNGRVIHPDFAVLHKKKRRIIYWEHRGMMENPEYAKHALLRVRELEREGIFLGESLILTEESASCPLGTEEINRTITHYFKEN